MSFRFITQIMGLFLFTNVSLAATAPLSARIKNIMVRLEATSGQMSGSRLALDKSDVIVDLNKQADDSQTSISDVFSGTTDLKVPEYKLSLSIKVSQIVTAPRRFPPGFELGEIRRTAVVTLNGQEIGLVSSKSEALLEGISLVEKGAEITINGAKVQPVVSIDFAQ